MNRPIFFNFSLKENEHFGSDLFFFFITKPPVVYFYFQFRYFFLLDYETKKNVSFCFAFNLFGSRSGSTGPVLVKKKLYFSILLDLSLVLPSFLPWGSRPPTPPHYPQRERIFLLAIGSQFSCSKPTQTCGVVTHQLGKSLHPVPKEGLPRVATPVREPTVADLDWGSRPTVWKETPSLPPPTKPLRVATPKVGEPTSFGVTTHRKIQVGEPGSETSDETSGENLWGSWPPQLGNTPPVGSRPTSWGTCVGEEKRIGRRRRRRRRKQRRRRRRK